MAFYSEIGKIGKGGIVKEGIFERFKESPDLRPACPDNYGDSATHKKLLIVGESNYLEENTDSVFKDPEAWYKGEDTQSLLPKDEKEKKKVIKDFSNWKANTINVNKLCESMNAVGIKCGAVYDEAVYYNYFLRPAIYKKGDSTFEKDCTDLDREVAGEALCGIIDLLTPDIVIFASKYAFEEFQKYRELHNVDYKDTVIEYVNHPSWASWNDDNGKQKFEELLKKYWLK